MGINLSSVKVLGAKAKYAFSNIGKSATKSSVQEASAKFEKTSKQLSDSLEKLATTNKAGITNAPKNIKQCCISAAKAAKASEKQVSAEATKQAAKKLAEESIKTGLSAEQAAKGAKEVMAATGGLTGKSAIESAMVFSKAPTQAELKAELLLKHGDKLKAKHAQKAVQEEIAKLDKLL